MATTLPTFRSYEEFAGFTAQLLREWIGRFDRGEIRLHVPKELGLMQDVPGMHFHLTAELFFQISGMTTFEFPEDKVEVYPGEICLVPAGLPHREQVRAHKKTPFFNLVFHYGAGFFRFHVAHEVKKGQPAGFYSHHVSGLDPEPLRGHLKSVVEWFYKKDPARDLAVKSALLDHLFVIMNALEHSAPPLEPFKMTQIEAMVAYRLSNPDLSVAWIARHMERSPDYVARLFRRTTGKSLAAFIIEQRMRQAKHLLETSSANISEVSCAVGYENSNYFSQLFRRAYGMSPRRYREDQTHAKRGNGALPPKAKPGKG